MAFNKFGKPTWSVNVEIEPEEGEWVASEWSIVASSAPTACQRGVNAAIRQMRREKIRGRSKIARVQVDARPDR